MRLPRVIGMRLAHLMRVRRRDRGAASIFVLGMAVVLFGVAGLAVDGGTVINEKDKAHDVAEQAARAGANQIALGPLRDQGVVTLDSDAARNAAASFVTGTSAYQLDGAPIVAGNTVTVSVRKVVTTSILSIVGINEITIDGSATASPVTGINGVAP